MLGLCNVGTFQQPQMQYNIKVFRDGPFAAVCCEPRQVRKEATVTIKLGAEDWRSREAFYPNQINELSGSCTQMATAYF